MRGRVRSKAKEAEVDLTPMLDVVFILLIFFIVTAVFAKEQALGLEPPPPEVMHPPNPVRSILIYVNEDGLIRVDGRVTDISLVRANIERLRAEKPDSALVIQVDPTTRTGTIMQIRDAAYSAGFTRNVNVVLSESVESGRVVTRLD